MECSGYNFAVIESFVTHFAYAGVLLVLLLSGFGLPIPEDLPLILGGYLCATGRAELEIMIPLTLLAVVGADVMVYALGRRYGYLVPQLPMFRRFLTPSRLERAGEFLVDHGGKALFAGRFMPGLRTPIFFTAGLLKVPFWKFLLADGLAALISVPTLVLVGWYFSSYLEEVRKWAGGTQIVFGVLLVAVIGGYIWYKRRRQKADQCEALDRLIDETLDQAEQVLHDGTSPGRSSARSLAGKSADAARARLPKSGRPIIKPGRNALFPEP